MGYYISIVSGPAFSANPVPSGASFSFTYVVKNTGDAPAVNSDDPIRQGFYVGYQFTNSYGSVVVCRRNPWGTPPRARSRTYRPFLIESLVFHVRGTLRWRGRVHIMDGVGAKERTLLSAGAALLTLGSALAWQMPWREYPGQDNIAIPPDSNYVVYSMTH